jgi:tetratricopeptide (TPR) repeat protein
MNETIDYNKTYNIAEIEQWHHSKIYYYAIKLAERGEKDLALQVANLLKPDSLEYESDFYFNIVSEIAIKLAKIGRLNESEELISKKQMPSVNKESLEDSINALIIIAKEYLKRNNSNKIISNLLLAEEYLIERAGMDESQAILALELGVVWETIKQYEKAVTLWNVAFTVANNRLNLIISNEQSIAFPSIVGFEERKIIVSALKNIMKHSKELAFELTKQILDTTTKEKIKLLF